jgi:hypothetical protein
MGLRRLELGCRHHYGLLADAPPGKGWERETRKRKQRPRGSTAFLAERAWGAVVVGMSSPVGPTAGV